MGKSSEFLLLPKFPIQNTSNPSIQWIKWKKHPKVSSKQQIQTNPNQYPPKKKSLNQALQPTKNFQFRAPVASQRTLTFTSCCSTAAARSRTTRLPQWRHRSIAELGKSLLGKKAPSNRAGKSTVFPYWEKKMGIDSSKSRKSNIGFSQVYNPPTKKNWMFASGTSIFDGKKVFHYGQIFRFIFLGFARHQQKKTKRRLKENRRNLLRFFRR